MLRRWTGRPPAADELRILGLIEQGVAFERGWQYPITTKQNPEVAARVQALWSDYNTKRLFGTYEMIDIAARRVIYEDVPPLYHTITKLPLPLRATETERPYRLRPGEDDAPLTLKEQFFNSMATAELRLDDPTSYAAMLHGQLSRYAEEFPGAPHSEIEADMLGVIKRLLYSASQVYGYPLCNAKTLTQTLMPPNPERWKHMDGGFARLEIEFECVDEKCSEDGSAPVSGMHLNWPYHKDGIADEHHRVTIVRQVRRWRIVVDRDKLEWLAVALDEQALEAAIGQLEALSKIKPMFVSGVCFFHYVTEDSQGNLHPSAVSAHRRNVCMDSPLHLIEFRTVDPEPVRDFHGRPASPLKPISEYKLMRKELPSPRLSGHLDCRVGQQLWRDSCTKVRAALAWHRAAERAARPPNPEQPEGGRSYQRAVEEWGGMNEARRKDPAMESAREEESRRRAGLMRPDDEYELARDTHRPSLNRRRSSRDAIRRGESSAPALVAGPPSLPSLTQLKL